MTPQDGVAARRFARFTSGVHNALPTRLKPLLPPTFIGYALIQTTAFAIDMAFLSLFHGNAQISYPVAVTLGYVIAACIGFIINRWLNFREHGDLGKQSGKYAVVIVTNYLIWILAFSSLLEWAGVQYQISRFTAACIEGIYIYLLMRFWVFPKRSPRTD